SYMSALLWFVFLTLSTVEAVANALRQPEYFPHGASLFPEWPIWRPDWALWLLAVIAMILFLPKILSVVLIVLKRRSARAFGGGVRLSVSVLLEILLSSLLAPIRMVFHSRFVRAAVDPYVNALHRALLGRSRSLAPSLQAARQALLERALAEGPASLTGRERRILLGDPDLTDALHRRVWALPDRERAARWG